MKIHNFSLKDEQIEVAKFGLEHLVIIMLHLFFFGLLWWKPKMDMENYEEIIGLYIYGNIEGNNFNFEPRMEYNGGSIRLKPEWFPSWNTKPWPAGNPNFLMMISCYKMRTFHRLDSRVGHFILPHSRWKIMENPQWLSPLSYHRWLNFHRIPGFGLYAYHLQLRGHWCAVAAPWPRTGGTLDFLQFHPPLQAPARKARSRHDLRCSRLLFSPAKFMFFFFRLGWA